MSSPKNSESNNKSNKEHQTDDANDNDEQKSHQQHYAPPSSIVHQKSSASSSPTKEDHSGHYSLLYSSYFFAAWGDRMWAFAAILFLMQLFPTSLFPSSLFGFSENLAGIVCGASVGRFIDFNDRLKVIRVSIIGQNVAIFLATIVFVFALQTVKDKEARGVRPTQATTGHFFSGSSVALQTHDFVSLALIVVAGMIAKVTSSMNKISIHKDWAVVLAAGDSAAQTILNTNLRRVDLTCNIVAPLTVGVLSSGISPSFAVKVIGAWSVFSLFIELYLSSSVYSSIPNLQTPKKTKKEQQSSPVRKQDPQLRKYMDSRNQKSEAAEEELPEDSIYRAYVRHPIFPVSLAYCVLYISSLSFGGIMIAYLRTLGCSDALLALGRGIAAFVAMGSTFVVPSMVSGLGLVNAGKLASWLQVGALAPLAYVFLNAILNPAESLEQTSTTTFITVIFISVCLSRFGLWSFDLCQTQLMQESVHIQFAGRINGAQQTLTNICHLTGFVVTMLEDNPNRYAGPALIGFGSVVLCALIFTFLADDASARAVELKKYVEDKKKAEEDGQV